MGNASIKQSIELFNKEHLIGLTIEQHTNKVNQFIHLHTSSVMFWALFDMVYNYFGTTITHLYIAMHMAYALYFDFFGFIVYAGLMGILFKLMEAGILTTSLKMDVTFYFAAALVEFCIAHRIFEGEYPIPVSNNAPLWRWIVTPAYLGLFGVYWLIMALMSTAFGYQPDELEKALAYRRRNFEKKGSKTEDYGTPSLPDEPEEDERPTKMQFTFSTFRYCMQTLSAYLILMAIYFYLLGVQTGLIFIAGAVLAVISYWMQKSDPKGTWTNWGQNVTHKNVNLIIPETMEEVEEIIKKAVKEGKTVRGLGRGHTWSDAVANDGCYLIKCDKLNRILNIDKENKTVTIEPGVTTGQLAKVFVDNGLCIHSDVILESVQYGGVVAIICHGTGWDQPTICDYITEMELIQVTKDGKVVRNLYKYSDDVDKFNAIRGNFGLLGFISKITFKCEKNEHVKVMNTTPIFRDYLTPKNLKKVINQYKKGVEIFWLPYTSYNLFEKWNHENDPLWVKTFSDPENDKVKPPSTFWWKVQGIFDWLRIGSGNFVHIWSSLYPFFMGFSPKLLLTENSSVQHYPYAIHYQRHIDNILCTNVEFVFKIENDDFTEIIQAIKDVAEVVQKFYDKKYHHDGWGRFPINIAVECRFIGKSEVLLSPSYSKEDNVHFCFMEFLSSYNEDHKEQWEAVRDPLMEKWMGYKSFVGVHWAKEFPSGKLQGDLKKKLKKLYGERWNKFGKYVKEMDPKGVFKQNWMYDFLDISN